MDLARLRPALRIAAGVSLTPLLTACVLYLLLTRLGDTAGAWWAIRVALLTAIVTVAAVTSLTVLDGKTSSDMN